MTALQLDLGDRRQRLRHQVLRHVEHVGAFVVVDRDLVAEPVGARRRGLRWRGLGQKFLQLGLLGARQLMILALADGRPASPPRLSMRTRMVQAARAALGESTDRSTACQASVAALATAEPLFLAAATVAWAKSTKVAREERPLTQASYQTLIAIS